MGIIANIDPDKVKQSNEWHRFLELQIFRPGLNTLVDLNKFHYVYSDKGVDL